MSMGRVIDGIIEDPRHAELVVAYYTPSKPFAGSTFETLGGAEPLVINAHDLLAVTLLDVRLPPPTVPVLLGSENTTASRMLRGIRPDVNLWDDNAEESMAQASVMWTWLRGKQFSGIDAVIAGKILARKRPRLVPVIDSTVKRALHAPRGRYWASLRAALREGDRWKRVEHALRGQVPDVVPTLRLLDAAIWMRYSESENARNERVHVGFTVLPRRRR